LHSWSDGLAMRSAVHGVFAAGEPAEAARLAAVDGAVSHDGEGIHAGVAVAAAVAAAMGGAEPGEIVDHARRAVPADSWTARSLAASVAHAGDTARSEERRVGKGCRSRRAADPADKRGGETQGSE